MRKPKNWGQPDPPQKAKGRLFNGMMIAMAILFFTNTARTATAFQPTNFIEVAFYSLTYWQFKIIKSAC